MPILNRRENLNTIVLPCWEASSRTPSRSFSGKLSPQYSQPVAPLFFNAVPIGVLCGCYVKTARKRPKPVTGFDQVRMQAKLIPAGPKPAIPSSW